MDAFGQTEPVGGVGIEAVNLAQYLAHRIRWDVGAAKQDLAFGRQQRGGWPATHVVARIDVWALVVVNAHGYEAFVDRADDARIRIRRLVHHVAPMTPDGGDAEQHRLALGFG